MFRKIVISILFAFAAVVFSAEEWGMESSVFFMEHKGGDFKVDVNFSHAGLKYTNKSSEVMTPAAIATLYGPDERIADEFYWYDSEGAKKALKNFNMANAAAGIWQLRITVEKRSKIRYAVNTVPEVETGIMAARCWIWYKDTLSLGERYFKVPEGNKAPLRLYMQNCTARLYSLDGKEIAMVDKGSKNIPVDAGKVYKLHISTKVPGWNWNGVGGFPIILCRTPEFAERLNASLLPSEGGDVALGVHQRAELWKKSLSREDLEVKIADLHPYRKMFLAEPDTRILFGTVGMFSIIEYLLDRQDIDVNSPTFGFAKSDLAPLSFLYALNKPYNPYYKNKALLNRITLGYFDKMTRRRPIRENGTLYETDSNYAGADGMLMVPECLAFMLMKDDLDPDAKEIWHQLLDYPARRFFCDRVSCENQSAHWPVKQYLLYMATGKELYRILAENYVRDMQNIEYDSFLRTGYLQEAYGPDATYNGISTSLLAFYWHFSKDPNVLKLLDRVYTLLNHTVAPEPGGRVYGASGFSHRTMGGWYIRQYGGGTRLMAGELDSAACWHRNEKPASLTGHELDFLIKWCSGSAKKYFATNDGYASNFSFAPFASIWFTFPKIRVRSGAIFPAEEKENFSRAFNNEFYFMRRSGYYAGAYTGRTSGKSGVWIKNSAMSSAWKEKNGVFVMTSGGRPIFSPLQGLQLFWTPEYGMLLTSMNWNLYTHWNARLEDDKGVDWPGYPDTVHEYDENGKVLVIKGKMRTCGAAIERRIEFAEDLLAVDVKCGETGGRNMIEQLPYVVKPGCIVEFKVSGAWKASPEGKVSSIRWSNGSGASVEAVFDKERTVRTGKVFEDQGVRIGTLEIVSDGSISYKLSSSAR